MIFETMWFLCFFFETDLIGFMLLFTPARLLCMRPDSGVLSREGKTRRLNARLFAIAGLGRDCFLQSFVVFYRFLRCCCGVVLCCVVLVFTVILMGFA